jgi:hypothetical protein
MKQVTFYFANGSIMITHMRAEAIGYLPDLIHDYKAQRAIVS